MERKKLLVIGLQLLPEILRPAQDLGLEVILVASRTPADTSLFTEHIAVDHHDEEAVLAVVRSNVRPETVAGVIAFWEGSLHCAARVAEMLGMPGNPYESVRAMRDKFRTYEVLSAAKVNYPRSIVAHTWKEAERAADLLGYPLVAKPRASAASQAVIKVINPSDLKQAMDLIPRVVTSEFVGAGDARTANIVYGLHRSGGTGVLLQEHITGTEVAVDLIYHDGEYRLLGVHDKPQDWDGPFFLELAYATPPALPPDVLDKTVQTAIDALRAVGAQTGSAHVELRIGPKGPTVIEINGRLGGAYTQDSIRLSTGVYGPREFIRTMVGDPLDFSIAERKPAGFVSIVLEKPGRILAVEGLDEVRAMPEFEAIRTYMKPGDLVPVHYPENPNVFYAHVLLKAATREELLAAMQRVKTTLRVVVEEEVTANAAQ